MHNMGSRQISEYGKLKSHWDWGQSSSPTSSP